MRVLAIGDATIANETYADAVIDVAKLSPSSKQRGYDAVVASMALQKVPAKSVRKTAQSWVDALNKDGEFFVIVPSLEWVAYQVLSPDRSPALIAHLHGLSGENLCSFTMLDMRALLSDIGIAVTHAKTGEYMLGEHPCECHVLRGVKK